MELQNTAEIRKEHEPQLRADCKIQFVALNGGTYIIW